MRPRRRTSVRCRDAGLSDLQTSSLTTVGAQAAQCGMDCVRRVCTGAPMARLRSEAPAAARGLAGHSSVARRRRARPSERATPRRRSCPSTTTRWLPLQADDPRPQRVPQFPAGTRRRARRAGPSATASWPPASTGRRERGPRLRVPLRGARPRSRASWSPVKQGALVLGRRSTSRPAAQHPSISRRHAQLTRHGERFSLRDLRQPERHLRQPQARARRGRGRLRGRAAPGQRGAAAARRECAPRAPRAHPAWTPRPHGGARRSRAPGRGRGRCLRARGARARRPATARLAPAASRQRRDGPRAPDEQRPALPRRGARGAVSTRKPEAP